MTVFVFPLVYRGEEKDDKVESNDGQEKASDYLEEPVGDHTPLDKVDRLDSDLCS